jgi:hypothetical protein
MFFAKSTDGGKTLKTKLKSAPNIGYQVDLDTQTAASGSMYTSHGGLPKQEY